MKITIAKNAGFCKGVERAVSLAKAAVEKYKGRKIYLLGSLIHNSEVVKELGVEVADSTSQIENGSVVIIRSHGEGEKTYQELEKINATTIDATCVFVKKIHNIVAENYKKGKHIVIIGSPTHKEVIGINGWCDNTATIIENEADCKDFSAADCFACYARSQRQRFSPIPYAQCPELCIVTQTTFDKTLAEKIIDKLKNTYPKTVEVFPTICYTTIIRQEEVKRLSKQSDIVVVVGDSKSSNTKRLYDIARLYCKQTILVSNENDLYKKSNKIKEKGKAAIVAGASTPRELVAQIGRLMAKKFKSAVASEEFLEAVEEAPVNFRDGQRLRGYITKADGKGITVNLGSKKDGFIPKAEVCLGEYDPKDYKIGIEVNVEVITMRCDETGCILLSKKRIDEQKLGDDQLGEIRVGEDFEIVIESETKGGLLGKIGTYTVFIPAGQVADKFVKDISEFVGKTMKLNAMEIDDAKQKIVATAKRIKQEERIKKEEVFWNSVVPDVIVNGKVVRATNFGAFVSVDNIDCLVHVSDVSHTRINSVEDVLKVGESYDFLVLSVDKDRGRVALSYKALIPKPFNEFIEKHQIGSRVMGVVSAITKFGAFIKMDFGIEGLAHISELSHTFIKDAKEAVKVGQKVEALIKDIDPEKETVSLSVKACLAEPAESAEVQE